MLHNDYKLLAYFIRKKKIICNIRFLVFEPLLLSLCKSSFHFPTMNER